MSGSTSRKSGMRFSFRFSDMRIRTKLLAIIALIVTVFSMIVLTVVVSFHRIENVLGGVISDDMNNVVTNALTERELTSIVADLNLLLGTFFEDDAHLHSEGERLLEATRVLARGVKGSDLEAPLGVFGRRMKFLLEQCRAVNTNLRLVSDADRHIVSGFDRLEEVIADKLIKATLIGDDTSILQQLAVLIVGYRQSLLEIGKQHAERWPETYYAPPDMDGDPLIAAIEELDFRLRTLIAGDLQIINLGRRVIRDLQAYKNGLLALNTVMVELKKRMLIVEDTKFQATEILKKFDRDVVQAINAANIKVLRTFRIAEASLIVISLALIAALIVLTIFFFESIIKKPMDDIRDGIKAFRRGNLDARIDLDRSDEWRLIEDALNVMAAELSSSYADLKKAQSFVSNIIDSMPSILVAVDCEGKVTQWNRQTAQITGLSFEVARTRPLAEVLPRLAHVMARIDTAIRERRVITSTKAPRKEEEEVRYDDITIFPLITNGVEGVVVRVDDVTERVRLEELMIHSEKMLSVGGLAAGMAHEINNPLAGILQNTNVLGNRLFKDLPANRKAAEAAGLTLEALRDYLERRKLPGMIDNIRSSGMRASAIVKNMLGFARKSDKVVSSHDLGALLDRTLELVETDYDMKKNYDFRKIEIVRDYDPLDTRVLCEASKIQQVFLNLLKNGAEAMAEAAEGSNRKSPRFVLRVKNDGDRVRVEVEDNGPGMDAKTRRSVFEPFFTTKPVGKGTGLGLSVSYFIVTEDHGGEMRVQVAEGGGTCFVVRLPKTGRGLQPQSKRRR